MKIETGDYIEEFSVDVRNVAKSFNETLISSTADSIQNITESFAELDRKSNALQEEVKEILNIISTVSSIAEETSLLSLNASIEAARAGEAGKGVAVVAEEVGKLSMRSKDSALDIEQSLSKFTDKIKELTDSVNSQYNILNDGNLKLNNVSDSTELTTTKIDDVMNQYVI